MKFFPKNRFFISLLSSSISSAFLLAPTYAMDPPLSKQPVLSSEDQDVFGPTHSFSPLKEAENAVKNDYKNNFDDGFKTLCTYIRKPESTIESTTSLFQGIFKEFPNALPHWLNASSEKLLSSLKIGEDKDVPKFLFSPLNAVCLNRQNGIIPKLKPSMIRLLATVNWGASQQKPYPLNEIDRKVYKTEAMRCYIEGAKSGDEVALSNLLSMVDGEPPRKKEHALYYNVLIPLLRAKDQEAQKLFIDVCSKSEGAVKCIQRHIKKLEDSKKDLQQLECLKGLIADFEYREDQRKGKEAYKNAMDLWDLHPYNAIIALRNSAEKDYWEAQEKLEELRKTKGYLSKNFSKNDHGALLKKEEVQAGQKYWEYVETFLKGATRKNFQFSEEEISKASAALFKAVALGNQKAKEQEKKIKKLPAYTDAANGIDKIYTDPLAKLGKEYYRREFLNGKTSPIPQQPLLSFPEKTSIPPVQEKLPTENSKSTSNRESSVNHAKSKQQKIVSVPIPQIPPSTPIIIVPVNAQGEPTTSIPLPRLNEQEYKEKKEAVVLTMDTPTVPKTGSSDFNQAPNLPPKETKPRIKKTLEITKREKKPLVRKLSKRDSDSSNPSEESLPENTPSQRDKVPLQRTVSLNTLMPSEKPRGPIPTMGRRKSLSQIETPTHSGEVISPKGVKKPKKSFTQDTFKQFLKRRKPEKKMEPLDSQKESGEVSPIMNKAASPEVDTSYRKLNRSLSNSDLKRKSGVQLSEKIITDTLDDLQTKGIVSWHRKNNTISATKNDDPNIHITLHTHSNSDKKWFEKPECVTQFLELVSQCDPNMEQTINNIGKKEQK